MYTWPNFWKSASPRRRISMSRPRSSGMTRSFIIFRPSIMPVSLFQPDLALVPDHEPVGQGFGRAFVDAHFAADQAFVDPAPDINDLAALADNAVLDLGLDDPAVLLDGGERADVGIGDLGPGADDSRRADGARPHRDPFLDDHLAADPRGFVHRSLDHHADGLEGGPVGLEDVLDLPRV